MAILRRFGKEKVKGDSAQKVRGHDRGGGRGLAGPDSQIGDREYTIAPVA